MIVPIPMHFQSYYQYPRDTLISERHRGDGTVLRGCMHCRYSAPRSYVWIVDAIGVFGSIKVRGVF